MRLPELRRRAAANPENCAVVLWRRPGAPDVARTMLSPVNSIEDAGRLARQLYGDPPWREGFRPAAVAVRLPSGVEAQTL